MRPPDSIAIKVLLGISAFGFWILVTLFFMLYQDYAIDTPLKKLSEGDSFFEVTINLNLDSSVAALNFVLKVLFLNTLQQS